MLKIKGNKKSLLIKKHAKVSWILLEHKCLYYKLTDKRYNHLRISDEKYDQLERYYISICKDMKIKPSISKMVGFDLRKPSCALVMIKIKKLKKRLPIKKTLAEAKDYEKRN